MNNQVELVFDKTLTSLAGYDYGRNVYEQQVKGRIDLTKPFRLCFPGQIKGVASSFVQGFFEEIVIAIGLLNTEKNTAIVSDREGFAVMSKLQ